MIILNASHIKKFSGTLKTLHRSALPIAIRGALNDAAYDVKKNTLLKTADQTFIKRQPNFFKANSRVQSATGFDINRMQSTIGMIESGLHNSNTNYAVKDLAQQEDGGNIKGRSFVPMKAARGSGGRIKPNARIADIKKNIINAQKVRSVGSGFKKQRFIRAAIMAKTLHGEDAYILGNVNKGSQTLFKVVALHTGTRKQGSFGSRKLLIQLIPLYKVKKNRVVHVKKTDFMKRAATSSALKLEDFFTKQAQRQLDKYLKKL